MLSDLPRITELVSGRVRIRTQQLQPEVAGTFKPPEIRVWVGSFQDRRKVEGGVPGGG